MSNRFKQFLENYKIWRKRSCAPHAMYEKGDLKYSLFFALMRLIPALIFFGIIVLIIFAWPVS